MFRVLAFVFCSAIGATTSAQFVHNPYQDHSGDSLAIGPVLSGSFYSNYIGEYQIHLKDWLHWIDRMALSVNYRIEVVSFPFTPRDTAVVAGDRRMVMPALQSFGPIESGTYCAGWGWERNVPGQTNPRNLMRATTGPMSTVNAGSNNWMSLPTSLVSTTFQLFSLAGCGPDSINRQWLPHTVLKHTLVAHNSDGDPVDSVSWVYDNTRGRMRYYPFAGWGQGLSHSWDVIFRPVLLHDSLSGGHPYDAAGNGHWYMENGVPDSTANYFPSVPFDPNNNVFPADASSSFYPDQYAHPPPFSLLEAPLLNINGTAYAGYSVDAQGIQETHFADTVGGWEVPHIYHIDKPIDLRTINPAERIVYNPSSAVIDLDTAFGDPVLVFPSGYTFRTVHGVHPVSLTCRTLTLMGCT